MTVDELTDFDKRVYNLYLSSTRSIQNEPFTLRKDFSKMEESQLCTLKKVSTLFGRVPHLMCAEFFQSPYLLSTEKFFDLKFFASPKAIGYYTKYVRELENRSPDEQLEYIKKSYLFIYTFCRSKNIRLRDYPFYKTTSIEDCIKHIKDHKVSMYVIFSFPALYSVIINLESDIHNLFFGDISIQDLQNKISKSKVAFELTRQLNSVVSKKLDKEFES